jgi:hypothetical protein
VVVVCSGFVGVDDKYRVYVVVVLGLRCCAVKMLARVVFRVADVFADVLLTMLVTLRRLSSKVATWKCCVPSQVFFAGSQCMLYISCVLVISGRLCDARLSSVVRDMIFFESRVCDCEIVLCCLA